MPTPEMLREFEEIEKFHRMQDRAKLDLVKIDNDIDVRQQHLRKLAQAIQKSATRYLYIYNGLVRQSCTPPTIEDLLLIGSADLIVIKCLAPSSIDEQAKDESIPECSLSSDGSYHVFE